MFEREIRDIERYLEAVEHLGGEVERLHLGPPASEEAVTAVERELGVSLPVAFRRVLTEFASTVRFHWHAGEPNFPAPFDDIFSGELSIGLHEMVALEHSRRDWIEACFPDPTSPYDKVWHDKLAFMSVVNGDMLAMDLNPEARGRIVYLSHDGGDGHGYVMAEDMIDLIRRWAPLGCPGAEDWQWLPFAGPSGAPIDPSGPNALRWRELMLGKV
jgi:hypothetical protein